MSPITKKEDRVAAVYEGVVYSHKWHIDRLLKNRPVPRAVRMAGGAINSEVWIRIFADVLQIPIEIVEGEELGVKGAAMAAGIGVGIYDSFIDAAQRGLKIKRTINPGKQFKDIYQIKYEKYLSVTNNLDDV